MSATDRERSPRRPVVVVTGASRGIGAGIARRFGRDGAAVMVHYRQAKAEASAVAREIEDAGGEAATYAADIASEEAVTAMFGAVATRWGRVDVLVANAAVASDAAVAEGTSAEFDRVMGANLRGTWLCMREAARHMEDGGRIIAVSSGQTRRHLPGVGFYTASKAAVEALVVTMAREVGARGITVNAVLPGATSPGMFDRRPEADRQRFAAMSPMQRLGTPEEVADLVAYVARRESGWITGQRLGVDGGAFN